MIRLTYVSTCAEKLTLADVRSICDQASAYNVEHGISGMLFWSSEFFMQTLEGDRDHVSKCFLRIAQDKRHHTVVLIAVNTIHRRWFQEWGMGFTKLLATHRVALSSNELSANSFNPYLLESDELEEALMQLAASAKAVTPSQRTLAA
jgi:Sensors of blue-light using FAD